MHKKQGLYRFRRGKYRNPLKTGKQKHVLLLVLLVFFLLAACSQEPEVAPEPTQTPLPPPLSITYCDIDPSDVCLEGFGLDIEDRLLVLLIADDRTYADIYIRADGPDGEMHLECQPSESFPENIYCLGQSFSESDSIKLNLHSKKDNRLLAIGVFNVLFTSLPPPDIDFEADATPEPPGEPSYPNPSYPNPSYPNPTFAP